jgi:BirA family biotin operon repressor/biotin-[acetyl-CoA-carboxylase] ligase
MELAGAHPAIPPPAIHARAFAVLRRLTHEHFTSGEAIARELDLSRATVWQAVRELESLDLEIHKVRRQGYRLARPYDALDAAAVSRGLGDAAPFYRIDTVDICDSTNTAILAGAEMPAPPARVLAAELQTAGRGRRGRGWVSGLGTSLTFSVLRQFDQGIAALSGLSLAVGLAVAQALEELGAQDVALKWPNDILWTPDGRAGHAKLGGILIELAGDALGPTRAVIGIGVNTGLPMAARGWVMNATGQLAADLGDAGVIAARNRVLAAMLRRLHLTLQVFNHDGFGALRAAWDARHAYRGREVALLHDGKIEKSGVVEGVDANGALRIRTDHGIENIVSGELSLRPRATIA